MTDSNLLIWRLNVIAKGALSLIPESLSYFGVHFAGNSMSAAWNGPPKYEVNLKSGKLYDFVAWHTAAPVISERTAAIFRDVGVSGVEYLDFGKIRGNNYVAVNVVNVCDFIDFNNSDIFFPAPPAQGNPKAIAIRSDIGDVPKIFKMDRIKGHVFVSDEFADVLISEKLSGFGFTRLSMDVTQRALLGESLNDHPRLNSPPRYDH